MAIKCTKYTLDWSKSVESVEQLYVGRVLRVEKVQETRNWSDTMDYTDYRPTECTYALVWLGTQGVPPRFVGNRLLVWYYEGEVPSWAGDKVRDLEIHEQFAWVDCTNLFTDRGQPCLTPVADTFDMQLLHGGPEMIEGLAAWEAYHTARIAKEEAELAAEKVQRAKVEAEVAAKKAESAAKKVAKDAVAKAEAEALLARIPAKGTVVTVDGFTGKIFWTGASKYYGKWSARAGVKDSRGTVQWVPADKF